MSNRPKALLQRITDDFEQAFSTYLASDKDQQAFRELREAFRDWRGRRGDRGNGKHASRNAGCSLYAFLAYLGRKPQNIGRDRSLGEMVAVCKALFDDDADAQVMYTRLQNAWRTKGASERRPNSAVDGAQASLASPDSTRTQDSFSSRPAAPEMIRGSPSRPAPQPSVALASGQPPPTASPMHKPHSPSTGIVCLPDTPEVAHEIQQHKQQIIAARKDAADLGRHFCQLEHDDVVRALNTKHQEELARVHDEVARATRAQVEGELEKAYNARWSKLEREYDKAYAEVRDRKGKLEDDAKVKKYSGQIVQDTNAFGQNKRKAVKRDKEPGSEYKKHRTE